MRAAEQKRGDDERRDRAARPSLHPLLQQSAKEEFLRERDHPENPEEGPDATARDSAALAAARTSPSAQYASAMKGSSIAKYRAGHPLHAVRQKPEFGPRIPANHEDRHRRRANQHDVSERRNRQLRNRRQVNPVEHLRQNDGREKKQKQRVGRRMPPAEPDTRTRRRRDQQQREEGDQARLAGWKSVDEIGRDPAGGQDACEEAFFRARPALPRRSNPGSR